MAWSKDGEKREKQEKVIRICENCGKTFKLNGGDEIVCPDCYERAMSIENDPWQKK